MKKRNMLKKIFCLVIVFAILLTSFGVSSFIEVFANVPSNNTKLSVTSSNNTISIDGTDTNKLIYKIGDTIVGTLKVKRGDNYFTPVMNGENADFVLDQYVGDMYQISLEITPSEGYNKSGSYMYNGSPDYFPGDGIPNLDIEENNIHVFDFEFVEEGNGDGGNGGEPQIQYPIVYSLEGDDNFYDIDFTDAIILNEEWTHGKITFKAKACLSTEDNSIVPNDGMNECVSESEYFEELRIEGIVGLSKGTVTGGQSQNFVNVSEDFSNYKFETIHLANKNQEGPSITKMISLVTDDAIIISAEAEIDMSYGVGSVGVKKAVVTDNKEKDLSIFFGNEAVTLFADGVNVDKINKINGKAVTVNSFNGYDVDLPDLSIETSTKLELEIRLRDGSFITRTVNIKRTAIILDYDKREGKLKAGYVMNKNYLYNGLLHDSAPFDAYLQVMLYKDNKIVGYKQVQIDDKEIVDGLLQEQDSWSIETFDEKAMLLYEGDASEVNGAGVFLTNGPVKYDSEKLPSIEFGVGAGLRISWGE